MELVMVVCRSAWFISQTTVFWHQNVELTYEYVGWI